MFSLSDLTPRQGAVLDRLGDGWQVVGRCDSQILTADEMEPQPYPAPPTLLLLRDPNGNSWQIDRSGNLAACF